MKGKTINVTPPRILILLSLFLVIFFAVYLAFDLLVPRAPSMATIRCLVGFVWIPLLIVILWVLTFHVRAEGTTILFDVVWAWCASLQKLLKFKRSAARMFCIGPERYERSLCTFGGEGALPQKR